MSKLSQKLINELKINVYRSTIFSTKVVNKCELTNKTYDENEKIYATRLLGSHAINLNYFYGEMFFHPENKWLFKYANIVYEFLEKIIQKHSLQKQEVYIERSNGTIDKAKIESDAPIRLFNDERGIAVFVKINDQDIYKWISFKDHYCKTLKRNIKGLFTLNPELKSKATELYFDNPSKYLESEQNEYIRSIKDVFKDENITCRIIREI